MLIYEVSWDVCGHNNIYLKIVFDFKIVF